MPHWLLDLIYNSPRSLSYLISRSEDGKQHQQPCMPLSHSYWYQQHKEPGNRATDSPSAIERQRHQTEAFQENKSVRHNIDPSHDKDPVSSRSQSVKGENSICIEDLIPEAISISKSTEQDRSDAISHNIKQIGGRKLDPRLDRPKSSLPSTLLENPSLKTASTSNGPSGRARYRPFQNLHSPVEDTASSLQDLVPEPLHNVNSISTHISTTTGLTATGRSTSVSVVNVESNFENPRQREVYRPPDIHVAVSVTLPKPVKENSQKLSMKDPEEYKCVICLTSPVTAGFLHEDR